MGDITSTCEIRQGAPSMGQLVLEIETPSTADNADTIIIDMDKYGADGVLGVDGWSHTTANSVVVYDEPITSVTTGTLTLTISADTGSNDVRYFRVYLRSGDK